MINDIEKLGLAYLLAAAGNDKSLTERLKQVDDDLKSMAPAKKTGTEKELNGRRRIFVNGKWREVALYDDDSEELLSETAIESEEDDD